MARGESIPSRPIGQRAGEAIGGFFSQVLSSIGRWIMWPILIIFAILSRILGGRRYGRYGYRGGGLFSGGGGSFGGGSFGGGFSGGGGASGSW